MAKQINHFYEFGSVKLDATNRLLYKNGTQLSLQPRVIETLLILVKNAHKVVDKNTLLHEVWQDVIVEEGGLKRNVSLLRKALGDEGRFIETLPKRGYRFTAEVKEDRQESELHGIEDATGELVLQRRTSLQITHEEEPSDSSEGLTEFSKGRFSSVLPGHGLAISAAAIVLLLAGVGLLWAGGRFRSRSARAPIKSLAVLPLKSFTSQGKDEELRLRIADALITKLGGLTEISVRPTDSVLRFAREDSSALDAGRLLGVEAVLDGRIQTEGDNLRVTLQLISVDTNEQTWSGQFDGKLNEILNLQDKISAALLPQLALSLTKEQTAALAKNPTTNAEAYELYLKGRYLWNRRTSSDIHKALGCFQQAIALDPDFAVAYAGLADAYSMLTNVDAFPRFEGYAKAKEMAQKALTIDPNLSEAYSALGWILHKHEWNWAEAEKAFAKAIALNPNNAEAHHWRGLNFRSQGMIEEYVAEMEKARALAPLTKPISQNYYSVVLEREGCEKALEYLKSFHTLYVNLPDEQAISFAQHDIGCGNYHQAIAMIERIQSEKVPIVLQVRLAVAYAKTGNRQEAAKIIARIKRTDASIKFYLLPYVYVALNDFDSAFANLEQGIEARDDRFTKLKQDTFLAPLRSDVRFKQLLKKMNLPE